MSEFNMYRNDEDNEDDNTIPSSLTTASSKEQKIDVRSIGKLTSIVIDGKEVFIIDPSAVQRLNKKISVFENDLRNMNINLSNARKVIESLQSRIVDLEKNMSRIFND